MRSSCVELRPEALDVMSMWMEPLLSVYSLIVRTTVARPIALRVSQEMPWRARRLFVSSERDLFCCDGLAVVFTGGGRLFTYHYELP